VSRNLVLICPAYRHVPGAPGWPPKAEPGVALRYGGAVMVLDKAQLGNPCLEEYRSRTIG